MWKWMVLSLTIGINAYADKVANPAPANEEIAISGPPTEPNTASCLSENSISDYEKRASGAIRAIEISAKENPKPRRYSLRNVREALIKGGLLPEGTMLGTSANNSEPELKKANFVNLLECDEFKEKFRGNFQKVPWGSSHLSEQKAGRCAHQNAERLFKR